MGSSSKCDKEPSVVPSLGSVPGSGLLSGKTDLQERRVVLLNRGTSKSRRVGVLRSLVSSIRVVGKSFRVPHVPFVTVSEGTGTFSLISKSLLYKTKFQKYPG